MKRIIGVTILFLLLPCIAAASSNPFDGTQPLLCASIEAIDCVAGTGCKKEHPEVIGAPQFMRINFAGKEILGTKRVSPIINMEENEEQIILQGMELGMGWVFSLDRDTGKFSATLAGGEGVFVIFGACTPLDGEYSK